jgi:hypothetical protein
MWCMYIYLYAGAPLSSKIVNCFQQDLRCWMADLFSNVTRYDK